jgi:hypothetical protein
MTLTPEELDYIFPTMRIFILPDFPLVVSLPSSCITYRGLSESLRWYEASMTNSASEFSATFPELVEVCQCLLFFGAKPSTDPNIAFMRDRVRECIESGLCQEEAESLWSLRFLPFVAPFITLMVKMIAGYVRFHKEIGRNPWLRGEIMGDEGLLRGCQAEEAVIRWVEMEAPELRERVDEYMAREKERDRNVMKEVERRERYGYIYKRGCGVTFLAKSAVSCAQMGLELEVVWEELDEDQEVVMTDQ